MPKWSGGESKGSGNTGGLGSQALHELGGEPFYQREDGDGVIEGIKSDTGS